MSLAKDLLERPAELPLPSKYTVINGLIYLGAGATLIVWPGVIQTVFGDPAFIGREGGLFRVIGAALAVVGWLCLMGGRSGAQQIVAATVPDRLLVIPAVLLPLAFSGVFPHFLISIAILDPVLGIGAWVLLSRKEKAPTALSSPPG